MSIHLDKRSRYNLILFTLNFIFVFILGLFDGMVNLDLAYFIVISLIIMTSTFTIKNSGSSWFYLPVITILIAVSSEFLHLLILAKISAFVSLMFFLFVIVLLVIKVAKSRRVSLREFLESINVYLLLGIAGFVLFRQVGTWENEAFMHGGQALDGPAPFVYYSFVTMTTLGYGDIAPTGPVGRSLAIFFSVAGQLYLTMIIALLVGKYLSQGKED